MSLGGLDSAAVKEAHEAATAEPGGWFLLKYSSRDEVELHSRGTTGVVEMRKAIAQYEEASPLYGFLKYRRRNVIIKYQPEGCSRLVQARATVHFNAICEHFQPYNTTFELTTAKDLKDSKLSAACSSHTASGSVCSSTSSLRRRRLMEITEEEEEEERERKRQSIEHDEKEDQDGAEATPHSPPLSSEPPVVLDRQQITDPQDPDFTSIPDPATFSGAEQLLSPSKSEFDIESPRRKSSQLTRPELYTYSSNTYGGKPKVKLAPRPSMDTNKRPNTAGNYRPIAALPAGFKLSRFAKKNKAEDKVVEEEIGQKDHGNSGTTATNPDATTTTPQLLPPRPATSSGAPLKGMPSMSSALADKNKMTPEKARLMKAMKLREKKQKMSMLPAEVLSDPEPSKTENTLLDVQPEDHAEGEEESRDKEDVEPATAGTELATTLTIQTEANTEDTSTASHPPSPTIGSSEVGVSTKASSLSEATDETIQHTTKDTELDVEDGPLGSETEVKVSVEVQDTEKEPTEPNPIDSTTTASNIEVNESPIVDHVSEDLDAPLTEDSSKFPEHDQHVENFTTVVVTPDEGTASADEPKIEVQIPQSNSGGLAPPDQFETSAKSPLGVPHSKFSSNEAKPPAAPTLKSRFSTQDLRKASFAEQIPAVAEVIPPSPEAPLEKVQPIGDSNDAGSLEASSQLPSKLNPKPAAITPIRTELIKDTPQSEISDPLLDEALLDELQAATVQHAQAQPMTVAKSPINPVFPNTSPKKTQDLAQPRSVSSPFRTSLHVPGDPGDTSSGVLRSASVGGSSFNHTLKRPSSSSSMQAKKNNIGSSISQRIKALEQLSSKESSETLRPKVVGKTATPSGFITGRKTPSIRDQSSTASLAGPAGSHAGRSPTPEQPHNGSPDHPNRVFKRDRSSSVASRLSVFEPVRPSSSCSTYAPRGRPESIQVTARIVRDGGQTFPKRPTSRNELQDYDAGNLKQSPLVVDHQKAEPAPKPPSDSVPTPLADAPAIIEQPKGTILERRSSRSGKATESDNGVEKKRRSSMNVVRGFMKDRRTDASVDKAVPARSPTCPPSVHHNGGTSIARRLSISSRRSMSRERDMTPIMSPTSVTDAGSESDEKAEKQSRASRLMRRLSNSFGVGSGRKGQSPSISPTVAEEDDDASTAVTSRSESQISSSNHSMNNSLVATYLGDVNVQFPDNLLWKRRSMCLDSAGFLLLTALQGHAPIVKERTVGTKRYHMSDFRLPYIPDVEVEELPNSVVLDFVEGSGLQIACEDRAGQMSILHALEDAHQRYST